MLVEEGYSEGVVPEKKRRRIREREGVVNSREDVEEEEFVVQKQKRKLTSQDLVRNSYSLMGIL